MEKDPKPTTSCLHKINSNELCPICHPKKTAPKCSGHNWIASKFVATSANSAFMTGWKVTHIKCINCREEREL
jgi:formate dehydrogenase maturation protein FdhE